MNYITNEDTIIFSPEFDDLLDIELISNYKKLIFSNYILNDKLFEAYESNNFNNLKCRDSKFNELVNNLPQCLTYLTFGRHFNQRVNKLPQGLTHLTFGVRFNQEVNVLPQNLTHLTFCVRFNQEVNVLPQNLTHLTFGLPRK